MQGFTLSGVSGTPTCAEALHGSWASEKGKCTIGKDPVTARLCYMEDLEAPPTATAIRTPTK
eukprot:666975-Amphidinium_carterae.1